jgi:hypothetical protein
MEKCDTHHILVDFRERSWILLQATTYEVAQVKLYRKWGEFSKMHMAPGGAILHLMQDYRVAKRGTQQNVDGICAHCGRSWKTVAALAPCAGQ